MSNFAIKQGESIIAQALPSLWKAVMIAEWLEEYTKERCQIVVTQATVAPDCVIEFVAAREKHKQAMSDDKDRVIIIKG